MRTLKTLLAAGMVVLGVGCKPLLILSFQPLFTEQQAVSEPALVGLWAAEDDGVTWAFQDSGEESYDLLVTGNGRTVRFRARLGRLGESLFLDISLPSDIEAVVTDATYLGHLIPVHTIWRIWIEGDVLRLSILDPGILEIAGADETAGLALVDLDERVVINTPTPALQEFVLKHADTAEAFLGWGELHRRN